MSSRHHVLLMLSCVLLVLLVQAPGTRSRPSTEETDTEFAPRWLNPEKMTSRVFAVPAGLTVKFRCKATGNPVPTLHWFKNQRKITNDQRAEGFKIRDSHGSLIMDSAVPSDRGNYTCVVENKHGRLEHTYQLDVVERRPHRPILQAGLPANQTAVVGSDVSFECRVFSDVPSNLQWLKHIEVNGSHLGPVGLPNINILKSLSTNWGLDVLTLRNVALEDAGVYTCLVGNYVGISHQSAWLTVLNSMSHDQKSDQRERKTEMLNPEVTDGGLSPADQTAVVGSDVALECALTSETRTHIQWLKHITVNGCGHKPEVRVLKTSVKDGGEDVLTLRNVTLDDAGEYMCLTGNSEGVSYQSVWLTVINSL